jgi:accessory gene regulator protein AgrB
MGDMDELKINILSVFFLVLISWYLKVLTCNKLYYPLPTSTSVDIKVFIFILAGYCVMLNNYGWKKL